MYSFPVLPLLLTWARFVDFAMHRVRMLQHFGVIPFLIFDGDYLPSKANTEADRDKRRNDSRKLGLELLKSGKSSQAYLEFQKAVDVTPAMARQLIEELKQSGVQYIVAPYEADAQMVYLERQGIVDGILSEDSDLLVFGAKCLLTKLDQYGDCIEINRAQFCACRDINLAGWTDKEFRQMAILSGCDYLNSINNMGLKTAYRMIRKHKTIEKVIRMLQFDGKYHVPKGYLEEFYKAELTFLHQRVYCPRAQKLVFHTEPEQHIDAETLPFIGGYVEPVIAKGVATGELNPMTKKPIHIDHSQIVTPRNSYNVSRPQPRRAATSDDLKKGVSIERFFMAKRVPLAELDINCFTPSPSQQNALHRNSGPWLAAPVNRPYNYRASTGSVETSRTELALQSLQNSRSIPKTKAISESRPSKRARLCADDAIQDLPGDNEKVALAQSHFFTPTLPESSPSGQKTRRGKKEDINIFSDDSIEEALLNLPDIDGFSNQISKAGKIIHVFDEQAQSFETNTKTSGSQNDEAINIPAESFSESQTSVPKLSQSTLSVGSTCEPSTPTDNRLQTPAIKGLKEKFAFTPNSHPFAGGLPTALDTPPSSAKPSRIPIARPQYSAKNNAGPSVLKAERLSQSRIPRIPTALQTLGAKALSRYALPASPVTPYTPATTRANHKPFLNTKTAVPFPEFAITLKPAKPRSPRDVMLPAADDPEKCALKSAVEKHVDGKGSEDLIIQDSENENESESEDGDGIVVPPSFNPSKFVFKG